MPTLKENQSELPVGSQLGDYRVRHTLGKGAFGITYLALKSNKPYVVKEFFPISLAMRAAGQSRITLLAEQHHDEFQAGLTRFQTEAEHLRQFQGHPNIVTVVDHPFMVNETAYFVMDHIPSQSLQQQIDATWQDTQKALSEADIIHSLEPILNGLDAIHKAGLLHLDIKPENILQTHYGEPILIDFGAVKVDASKNSVSLSQYSSMFLTHGYAPTEQYSQIAKQSAASDLYALGMTLYKMMAPDQVIHRSTDRKDQVFDGFPDPLNPLEKVAPGYSEALYKLVNACTQLKQKDRPQSVAHARELLGSLLSTHSQTTEPNNTKKVDTFVFSEPEPEAIVLPSDEHQRSLFLHHRTLEGKGNDFVKISSQGKPLAEDASEWDCVLDRNTGLYWENKTTDGGPRDYRKTYRWGGVGRSRHAFGSGDALLEGEIVQVIPEKHSADLLEGDVFDDWTELVKAANRQKLGGFSDWRVPTIFELKTLSTFYSEQKGKKARHWPVKNSEEKVYLNPSYFPTVTQLKFPWYWSSSPYVNYYNFAWRLNFEFGYDNDYFRNYYYHVRLVRSGQ